ncbi:cadherin-like beta sandwich domain-containing protein [Acholeplasma sp. OttesenSCG-928-E16]|nr:cadherin-like beta sandwich domain-containing protein [Acholeplasma sp. OttesenSCG-928-E16]
MTSYQLSVEYDISSVNVIVNSSDPLATTFGRGTHKLYGGENTITIYALAQNGTKGTEYTIVVTRKAPLDPTKDNNKLDTLVIDGFPLTFDSSITEYFLEVPFEISAINLIANANDPYAVAYSFSKVAEIVIADTPF